MKRKVFNKQERKITNERSSVIGAHINWNVYNDLVSLGKETRRTLGSLISEAVENFLDAITADDIEASLYNFQTTYVTSRITEQHETKLMEIIDDNTELTQTHVIKEAIRKYLIKQERKND